MERAFTRNSNFLDDIPPAFLIMFFYLTDAEYNGLEHITEFLQKHKMVLRRLRKEKYSTVLNTFHKNANFVAKSCKPVSQAEFEVVNQFFVSNVIVVTFFYHNQI
jgi:hypothetical protein